MLTSLSHSSSTKVLLFRFPEVDTEIQGGPLLNQDRNGQQVVGLEFRPMMACLQSLYPFHDVHQSYL